MSLAKYHVKSFVAVALLFCQLYTFADINHLGFGFENEKEVVTIPFKKINNLILLEATIDDEQKLNLILDTGIRSLVIFNKSYLPHFNNQDFQIQFTGTGIHTPIPAKVSTGHNLRLSQDVVANQINAVVLNKSNKYLHKMNGVKIHGIFGYQLFVRFEVKLDFKNKIMTLSEPMEKDHLQGFSAIPLTIHDTKPFVQIDASTSKENWFHLNLILDLGANHKILIHEHPSLKNFYSHAQERRIAEGLNGTIYGRTSTFERMKLGDLYYSNVQILLPAKSSYLHEDLEMQKHGSIGSKFFSNQTIVIDYVNEKLFIEKRESSQKQAKPLLTLKKIDQSSQAR
jgi:hypothetical protein